MTRDELKRIVGALTSPSNVSDEVMAAVDAYSAALLQQTPCSTLREVLVQMLNSEKENFGTHYEINDEVREKQSNINAIAHVLKLIEKRQPVA